MRETLLLCRSTLRAISVTPSTGSAIKNASSTRNPLSNTDGDGRGSPFCCASRRFHRHHHAGLEDRFDVLPQFQAGFAAVVVRQHSEGMPVAEGAVGHQTFGLEDLVEFGTDVLAHRARFDELQAAAVHLDVDLPQPQVLSGGLTVEQRPLQRGVVPGDHRKAVEREDVSALHRAACGPVVSAVGGAHARDVLAKDCALDLHPSVFRPGAAAQTMLGLAAVVLIPLADNGTDYRILVRSSFARYLAEWLVDAAEEYAVA